MCMHVTLRVLLPATQMQAPPGRMSAAADCRTGPRTPLLADSLPGRHACDREPGRLSGTPVCPETSSLCVERSWWFGPHQVAINRGRLAAVVRAAVADAPARRRAAETRAADAEFARDFLAVRACGLPRGLQHWPHAARPQEAANGFPAVQRVEGLNPMIGFTACRGSGV